MEPRSGALCLLALLALPGAAPLTVEETFVQVVFFQESLPSQEQSWEALQGFDGEEVLHVDWGRKEVVWRLTDLENFACFDVQGALGQIPVMKTNLEGLMRRSNETLDGHFVFQGRSTCSFPNGMTGPGAFYLQSYIYGRQEFLRFDSRRGTFQAITELGEIDARTLNQNKEKLEMRRARLDVFCRYNYGLYQPFASARKLKPQLKISPAEDRFPPPSM